LLQLCFEIHYAHLIAFLMLQVLLMLSSIIIY